MTDFNAALQAERALAIGRGVALDDVAQVGNLGFGQVAAEVHAGVVIALFIGAAAEVGHVGDGQVGIDGNVFLDADGAEIAGLGTEVLEDLGVGREAEAVLELRQMTGLDFVEVVVGTEQDEDDLGGKRIALFVSAVGGKHDALDGLFKGNTEEFGHVVALFLARGRTLHHLFSSGGADVNERTGLGQLDVGGVVAVGAVGDDVFTGIGDDLELVGAAAADRAGVGAHGAEHEAEAREDALIGLVHLVVGNGGALGVTVEGVGILHRELAAAHDAEAGATLVAELRLDVVEVHGKLTPALDFLTGDVSDDFFGSRLNHEGAIMTVLEAEKFGTVLFPAARLLPELGRLHERHQEFDRARAVHFLADDLLDLADRAQADRHVGVNAGGKLLDHAGTDHVLLADHISIGRRFFQRGKEIGTGAHFFLTCVC